ncbi:hypothetical protein FGG79_15150 [Bacillus sp. BHET2]|uniref:dimethylamine monooxygenase subunit DmmA family protein n=1 Tax=Bacillus sp. BHET2 TaxID=2583818 RepID=UPI00110E7882|nr:dimethylamine monooxygenase subunit DmmA family protein [Bacillus sp. BHET2]TMU85211.1 hypothetical protein FGG79_15150 [Bacillus sp. BHET2]
MNPAYVPNKRKYLFCGDHPGQQILAPLIKKAMNENVSFEAIFIGEKEETDIALWLQGQKMGCYLYIAIEWNKLSAIKKIAENCGFSDEEAQYIGHGVEMIHVFCCRCHQTTKMSRKGIKKPTRCSNCYLMLSVSDHFSPLKESYLGYMTTWEAGSD